MSGGNFPSWAVRGAKVVLVDRSPDMEGELPHYRHSVFTISDLYREGSRLGCRVAEWRYEPFVWTNIWRFRPVEAREHFKPLLDQPEHEPA